MRKEFDMIASPLILLFVLILIAVVKSAKGGNVGRILVWILIIPVIMAILAFFFPVIQKVAPSSVVQPPPVAYQPPANWVNSDSGHIAAMANHVMENNMIPTTQSTTQPAATTGKPWVDDFARFLNENPNHSWLLAQSPSPCVSQDEAVTSALNHAALQLIPFVHSQRKSKPYGSSQQMIIENLESSGVIRDRFFQEFKRPYGNVWRASLLIDSSPNSISILTDRIDRAVWQKTGNWRTTILSAIGFLLVVCGIYYLMDAITKGYFKTRLRIITISLAILGIFLLLLFVHNG
jgi:hypothetical protein